MRGPRPLRLLSNVGQWTRESTSPAIQAVHTKNLPGPASPLTTPHPACSFSGVQGLKPGSGLLSALARGLSILMNVPGSFSLPQEMISPSSGPSAVRPGPQAPGEAPATARHQGHREPLGDQPPSARPPPAPPTRAPRTVPSCLSGPGSPGSPECHSHQGDPVRPARRDRGVSRAGAPCHGATAESASLWRVLVGNGVLEGT